MVTLVTLKLTLYIVQLLIKRKKKKTKVFCLIFLFSLFEKGHSFYNTFKGGYLKKKIETLH